MGNFGVELEQHLKPSIARYSQFEDRVMQNLRVALPAIVKTFNAGPPQTISATIATNENVFQNPPGQTIALETQSTQIFELSDIPVWVPTAGGFSLTWPIQPGDECILLFLDTPLDIWFQNGGLDNNPIAQRRHSLLDAIALFGVRSTPRPIENYSTSNVQLRKDDSSVIIDLGANVINITAPAVNITGSGSNVDIHGANAVNISGASSVDITGAGNTTIEGRNFLAHEHSGVVSGGSITGGVV